MVDLDLLDKKTNRAHMKRLALEMCISFLARTISQSEFRVRYKGDYKKNDLYYHMNIRPNRNMTASTFWQKFVYKMIYDNEVLIIQARNNDLLIADDFQQLEYAVYDDIFKHIYVRGHEFKESYKQKDVIHVKFANEKLSSLIEGLFADYGDLFAKTIAAQKRKHQIRGKVKMDDVSSKEKDMQQKLQTYIDNLYSAFGSDKETAIVPEQKGYDYEELPGTGSSQSVDEINKITDGFLSQVAAAIGIPLSLLKGDMADVDKQTKNYMFFTVSPLLKKIEDEANVKFFSKNEWKNGWQMEVRKPAYRDIFDVAGAIDKLRSSGFANGNELRDAVGWEMVDDPILSKYVLTKNYSESLEEGDGDDNSNEGGDNE